MAFPTNPSPGDVYSLDNVRWYWDGDTQGWYRTYVGMYGERIKSYAPLTIYNLNNRVRDLEDQLEQLQSKSFLELE